MSTPELLPCPFCGGEATLTDFDSMPDCDGSGAVVGCNNADCIADVSACATTTRGAIKAWNRRAK